MKIVAIVLNNELISAILSEGVTDITSSEAAIYIDTPDNLLLILNAIGVEDTSKIEFFENNSNEEI